MIAWPLHSEQFINEKLVVDVFRIGLRMAEAEGEKVGDGGGDQGRGGPADRRRRRGCEEDEVESEVV